MRRVRERSRTPRRGRSPAMCRRHARPGADPTERSQVLVRSHAAAPLAPIRKPPPRGYRSQPFAAMNLVSHAATHLLIAGPQVRPVDGDPRIIDQPVHPLRHGEGREAPLDQLKDGGAGADVVLAAVELGGPHRRPRPCFSRASPCSSCRSPLSPGPSDWQRRGLETIRFPGPSRCRMAARPGRRDQLAVNTVSRPRSIGIDPPLR